MALTSMGIWHDCILISYHKLIAVWSQKNSKKHIFCSNQRQILGNLKNHSLFALIIGVFGKIDRHRGEVIPAPPMNVLQHLMPNPDLKHFQSLVDHGIELCIAFQNPARHRPVLDRPRTAVIVGAQTFHNVHHTRRQLIAAAVSRTSCQVSLPLSARSYRTNLFDPDLMYVKHQFSFDHIIRSACSLRIIYHPISAPRGVNKIGIIYHRLLDHLARIDTAAFSHSPRFSLGGDQLKQYLHLQIAYLSDPLKQTQLRVTSALQLGVKFDPIHNDFPRMIFALILWLFAGKCGKFFFAHTKRSHSVNPATCE